MDFTEGLSTESMDAASSALSQTSGSMTIWFIMLSLVLFLLCVAINVMILMQKKRSAGLSAGVVGMGQGDTYWDKNKSRSLEGKLERYTKIAGAAFMVIALVLNVIK